MNVEEQIFEVVIPMEDVIEFKGGRKVVVQKKVFPGYLLVRMALDDDSWYVVRNTPGVTGFVGNGARPTPLSRKEVENILGTGEKEEAGVEKKARPRLEFEVGEQVRVTTGPFADFNGAISDIDVARSKLTVLVNIFGRETPGRARARPGGQAVGRRREPCCDDARPRTKRPRSRMIPARTRESEEKMAKKKLAAIVKIQIPAGQATPAPPVGTALGPHGINIMDFCKAYNAATENQRGMVIPAEISIFEDRSFTFVTKTPPTPVPAPPGRGHREGRGEPAHRQGGQGHERAGAPDRRDRRCPTSTPSTSTAPSPRWPAPPARWASRSPAEPARPAADGRPRRRTSPPEPGHRGSLRQESDT